MINLPQGRVFDTAARDLNRALIRAADPGPARPTKTVAPPAGFVAVSAPLTALAAPAEGDGTGTESQTMPLVGGWSLTTDTSGSLIALHEDGSRTVLAARTVPAPGKDGSHG